MSESQTRRGRVILTIKDFKPNGCYTKEIDNNVLNCIHSADRLLYLLVYGAIRFCNDPLKQHRNQAISVDSELLNKLDISNTTEDYIVKVKIVLPKLKDSKNFLPVLDRLKSEGITYNGHIYDFFASKDPCEGAFFIRREIKGLDCRAIIMSIFDCQCLKSISNAGSRLGLLFSRTCHGLVSTSISVRVIEDTYLSSNSCVTDGSGFISLDLASKLPCHVIQGFSMQLPESNSLLPVVFQVRVISLQHGVFKGTLVVSKDLPVNSLVLRKSMLKVPSKIHQCDPFVMIDIVNTCRGLGKRHSVSALNRHLILSMHSCGVPTWKFENIAKMECSNLSHVMTSKIAAEQMIKQGTLVHMPIDMSYQSDADICKSLLDNDVSLQEPFLQACLWKHYRRSIDNLLNHRLSCSSSAYLMGIPDPIGILEPNQVFILRDSDTCNLYPNFNNECDVIVTRFPLMRESNIAIFQLSKCAELDEYFKTSRKSFKGGVIIFSIQDYSSTLTSLNIRYYNPYYLQNLDSLCPVDCMSGDYDGDMYFVCDEQDFVAPIVASRIQKLESHTSTKKVVYSNYVYDEEKSLISAPIRALNMSRRLDNSYSDTSDSDCQQSEEENLNVKSNEESDMNQRNLQMFNQLKIESNDTQELSFNFDNLLCPSPTRETKTHHLKSSHSQTSESKNLFVTKTMKLHKTDKDDNEFDHRTSIAGSIQLISAPNASTGRTEDFARRIDTLVTASPILLSDKDFSEALFWEFVIRSSDNNNIKYLIGKYANEWLVEADKHSIGSYEASMLASKHDAVMSARKDGLCFDALCSAQAISGTALFEQNQTRKEHSFKLPHYLAHDQVSKYGGKKKSSEFYHSKSILGRLYDVISAKIDSIDVAINDLAYSSIVELGVVLDSRIKVPEAASYLQLAHKFLMRYKDDFKALTENSGRKNFHSRGSKTIEESVSISDVSGFSHNMIALQNHYSELLSEAIYDISTRLSLPYSNVSRAIASALYEITYLEARNHVHTIKSMYHVVDNVHTPEFKKAVVLTKASMIDLVANAIAKYSRLLWAILRNEILDIVKAHDRSLSSASYRTNKSHSINTRLSSLKVMDLLSQLDSNLKPAISFNFNPPPNK